MSDRALVKAARAAVAVGALLTMFGLIILSFLGWGEVWPGNTFLIVFTLFCALVVWLVIPRQPRNGAVWSLGAGAVFGGIYAAAFASSALLLDDPSAILDTQFNKVIPAELAPEAAVLLMVAGFAVSLAIYVPMTLGLLLFPDGRYPSRRWRWVGLLAVASSLAFGTAFAWALRPSNTSIADVGGLVDLTLTITLASVVLSLAGLVTRFVRSNETIRQQFKWVVWGVSLLVPALLLAANSGGTRYEGLSIGFLLIAVVVFIGSYGIAIGRHRLFNVDLVISRTITYGILAALLAAVYALVVVGVGALFGFGDEPNLWLSIGAIALIAVAFEPLRLRVERRVNRLVYGKRATPHEVLANLTTQLADSRDSEGTMRRLVRLLAEGTGATEAVVWLRVGKRLRPAASEPEAAISDLNEIGIEQLPTSDFSKSVEVRYGDELLGALTITKPRSEPPTEADEGLLSDVAAGAGLLLRNIRLNVELADRAEEVSASRRRLIAAHDAARHRLERDLHDGAQQQVVALKVKLGLAQALAEAEAPDLVPMVSKLSDETQAAVDQMRGLAHGIYPPLLEAEGLGPALTASTRSVGIPVDLSVTIARRYPRQVEETIYFCVTELIGEAVMAGASRVTVEIADDQDGLSFDMTCDAKVSNLRSSTLADRIEAADGTLGHEIMPGRTRWTVRLPAQVEVVQ